LDGLPILEKDLGQIAAHPRPDLHRIDSRKLPGELVPLGDFLLQRQADGNRGRWRRGLRESRIRTDGGERQDGEQPDGKAGSARPQCAQAEAPFIAIPDFRLSTGLVFVQHGLMTSTAALGHREALSEWRSSAYCGAKVR